MEEHVFKIVLIYLIVINVATFLTHGIDTWKAKKAKWRIREVLLFMVYWPLSLYNSHS